MPVKRKFGLVMIVLLMLGISVFTLMQSLGTPSDPAKLEIVVPDSFRGPILFVDPAGSQVPAGGESKIIVRVPSSGVVEDPRLSIMFKNGYRVTGVRSESGRTLRFLMHERDADDTVALRETEVTTADGMWFVFGDREDWEKFIASVPTARRNASK